MSIMYGNCILVDTLHLQFWNRSKMWAGFEAHGATEDKGFTIWHWKQLMRKNYNTISGEPNSTTLQTMLKTLLNIFFSLQGFLQIPQMEIQTEEILPHHTLLWETKPEKR